MAVKNAHPATETSILGTSKRRSDSSGNRSENNVELSLIFATCFFRMKHLTSALSFMILKRFSVRRGGVSPGTERDRRCPAPGARRRVPPRVTVFAGVTDQ
jgi:hypothetical protein